MLTKAFDFANALLKHPCPECSEVGHLHSQYMEIKATLNDKIVCAEGEGVVCKACNFKFMSAELTELVANQVNRIVHGDEAQYLEVCGTGEIVSHQLN